MAHTFPAILKSVSMSVHSKKVTFELSPEHYEMYKDIITEEPGTQCLLAVYVVGTDEKDIIAAKNDPNHQKKQFLNTIYGIIGDYSKQTDVGEDKIKELLKLKLQAKRVIKESLSELNEQGGAQAIFILKMELAPSIFDYGRYKN